MKKLFLTLSLCLLGFANPSFASSGAGCGVWGTVSYVYISNNANGSVILALINGSACFVTGPTANMATRVAILSDALANGKPGYLTDAEAAISP